MSRLPDLTGPIGKLRAACLAQQRTPKDLRRNAAYWLAVRAGLRPELSSLRIAPDATPSTSHGRATAHALAAQGYLVDVAGDVHGDRDGLLVDLRDVLGRSPQTAERTGYADDPLVLGGLMLLAKRLRASDATATLEDAAEGRPGALPITLALPFTTATGVRPRLAAIDETNVAHMAAVTLAGLIPEAEAAATLPANVLASAPDRLVVEASLDRVPMDADFGNLLVLAALEVLVGSVRQTAPARLPTTNETARGTDLVFLVALREEFRILFEAIGRPRSSEVSGCTYYQFEHEGYRCQATLVGEMGTEDALLATERAIDHWNPRAVLFIGIAGGLHSDVKIGDVVVASQIDLYMANTKAVDDDAGYRLEPAGRAFHMDHTLLQRIRNVEFTNHAGFVEWRDARRSHLDGLLPDGTSVPDGLIRAQPAVLDGHVACGPTVGASSEFTRWLKHQDRKYLAIEMESGGAAVASASRPVPVPIVVLRGISDHADAEKTSLDQVGEGVFRSYAMANATRLALDVLLPSGLFGSPA